MCYDLINATTQLLALLLLLLVTILAKSFLSFVRSDLMSLSFFSTRHNQCF